MYTFTIIDNINSRRVLANVTPNEFAAITRAGGGILNVPCYKRTIHAIRASTDEEQQARLKKRLPAAFVSCHYTTATANACDPYTYVPLMQMDFDKKDNPILADVSVVNDTRLAWNAAGLCTFHSPRGGIKMVLPLTSTEQQHNQAYVALVQRVKENTGLVGDPNCKGVVRSLYLSYDPVCRWDDTHPAINPFIGYTPTSAPTPTSPIRWEAVDTSSVEKVFQSIVQQLEAVATVWQKGKHNEFLMGICECKRLGLELVEVIKLTHQHIAGRYRGDYTKEFVTAEVVRMYSNYFGKGIKVAQKLYSPDAIVFEKYLSEHTSRIWEQLQEKKRLYIDAPTGAGKTYMVAELARLAGCKVDLLMPTTALAMQQHTPELGIYAATGDKPLNAEQRQATILATCYESVGKASQRRAQILVVDEAHELVTAYGYRAKSIQQVQRCVASYAYIIYLSGSMFPLMSDATRSNCLRFQRQSVRTVDYTLVNEKGVPDAEYFTQHLVTGALNVFYQNDKQVLQALQTVLVQRRLQVALVTADTKEQASYTGIVEGSTLAGYDVLLTTCLIQSGVNINDETPVIITFAKGCTLMDYIQFVARFRRVQPVVRICHRQEMGLLTWLNEEEDRKILQAKAALYQLTAAKEDQREIGEHSYLRLLGKPDGIMEVDGQYEVDEYALQYQKYECATSSAARNTQVLHAYLRQHHFHYVPSVLAEGENTSAVKNAKLQVRDAQEEKVAAILNGLFSHTLIAKTKLEKDLQQRFTFFRSFLPLAAIKANPTMLTKKAEYVRQHNRVAYCLCKEAVAQGQALPVATRVQYDKLAALEAQFTADSQVPAVSAKAAVEAVFGYTNDNAVMETLGVLYALTRKRVRGAHSERGYVYNLGKAHTLPNPRFTEAEGSDEFITLLFAA